MARNRWRGAALTVLWTQGVALPLLWALAERYGDSFPALEAAASEWGGGSVRGLLVAVVAAILSLGVDTRNKMSQD